MSLRLKSLELQGYKSFAARSEFQFESGITAIVGPNGSGKSNVADAIRWALGEQSYSSLRGKKTEDMIYSGSSSRPRQGMAQVSMVLDNSGGELPIDFSEVTITRRAHRSGENEYLLNGNRVRLRDIYELLSHSSLSRQTYMVVGQGLVDAALSLRAEERRTLFEEAAGITLHRGRRAEVLTRLEDTRSNLLRVHDIVSEIEPRMHRLQNQAERAEQYQNLSKELQGLLRTWYGYRWREAQVALGRARTVSEDADARLREQTRLLHRLDARIDGVRAQQSELRERLSVLHSRSRELHSRAEAAQRELAVGEERARSLASRSEELVSEIGPMKANAESVRSLVEEAGESVSALRAELEAARLDVEGAERKLEEHRGAREEVGRRQAKAEEEARRLASEFADRESRLAQAGEARKSLLDEKAEREGAISAYGEQLEKAKHALAGLEAGAVAVEAELRSLEEEREQASAELESLAGEIASTEKKATEAEAARGALLARQDLLGRLRRDLSGYYDGVRSVLEQSGGGLSGVVGTAASLLEAPADLEVAFEVALGSHLQDLVMETWRDAEAAISHLKENRAGRATFLPLDTIRPPTPLEAPDLPGVIGVGSELVGCEERLRPVARLLLGRVLVVEDLKSARRAFESLRGGFQVVTRAGEIVRSGGSVTGGSTGRGGRGGGEGGGLLAREREWRELPAQIDAVEEKLRGLDKRLSGASAKREQLRSGLETTSKGIDEARARLSKAVSARDSQGHEIERLEELIRLQSAEQDRIAARWDRLEGEERAMRDDARRLRETLLEARAGADALAREAAAFSAEPLMAELSHARTVEAVVEGRVQSERARLDSHRESLRELEGQIDAKAQRRRELEGERESLLKKLDSVRERLSELHGQIAALSGEIGPAEEELERLAGEQTALEKEESEARRRLHSLETQNSRASLELSRCDDELARLRKQIGEDLGLVRLEMVDDRGVEQPPLPFDTLVSDLPTVSELPTGVEEHVKRLRLQIRRLGPINHQAMQEYAELRERYEFLSEQMADLEKASADLKEVISELDRLMESAFSGTFEVVSGQFALYFKRLFGGGEAQLVLTDPEDLTETGIDIVARPPGKRLQNLALLSGGERSLTAVALIFALLSSSPTPFCILDEVDAMLDEANVGRFGDALKELSERIQFIVITHNRRTVERSNLVYGISMGEDSSSFAISLNLDELEGSYEINP